MAEAGGALRAAISLSDGAVIADPFHRTTALVKLLHTRPDTLSSDQRVLGGTPTSLLRRLVGPRRRSWLTAS